MSNDSKCRVARPLSVGVKNCTSSKTRYYHILRFVFVRGLTTIPFVGGLGVEDQQNGLREVSILFHVISF
jgi:hypothetical protein